MTGAEQGFLLLTSHLGDPEQKILTISQLRKLAQRVRMMHPEDQNRDLCPEDLHVLGYDQPMTERILQLLSRQEQLHWYLQKAVKASCLPITRISEQYPVRLRKALGDDSPGCLWAKGDVSLLDMPAVSVVGSRELREENAAFAREAGKQAALQGYVLVSGNARGADRQAQESCLQWGGRVISIIADRLEQYPARENVLYLSEDGFDLDFTSQRALSRNRLIHAMGSKTFVAQCTYGKGGTWNGTQQNLRYGWSPVFCFADKSRAAAELMQMGAQPVQIGQLSDLSALTSDSISFL